MSICGGNESIVTEIFNVLDEGTFPKTENEAMISINAKDTLKLKIGEQIVITTPNGTEFSYIISGFMKNSANLMREDVYGVFLDNRWLSNNFAPMKQMLTHLSIQCFSCYLIIKETFQKR